MGKLFVAALAAVLVSGVALGQEDWKRAGDALSPHIWEFPRDHWLHEGYRSEWWYFVGFAETADGSRRFAWQFTVFRSGLALVAPDALSAPSQLGARDAAMGHAVVADLDTGQRAFSQISFRVAPGLARFGEFPDPEIAWLRGPVGEANPWRLEFRDGEFVFGAADGTEGLRFELTATPTRPPLFHGPNGVSEKSSGGGASLYYSQTRLRVAGRMGVGDEEPVEVTGTGWMDREFGSDWLAPDQVGWDWFGLNLDSGEASDGHDLMLYLMRRRDGTLSYASGTLRDAEGVRTLDQMALAPAVETLSKWTPPDPDFTEGGGRPYPAGWRVRLPDEGLDFTVIPLLDDQENRKHFGQPGPDIPYWEGAVAITATDGSGPLGRGFVELTGYRSEVGFPGLSPDTIETSHSTRNGGQNAMMDGLQFVFRWLHIFVGILWIGHLYFFNFVNAQMAAKLDGPTKQAVVPELMGRALYWFRWGAAWTWITGVILLLLIFYHGGLMFDPTDAGAGWGTGAILMVVLAFTAVFGYDSLWSRFASKVRATTIVSFLMLSVTVWLFVTVGGFEPRAVLIHTGVMFGTMMAFNVWFRIWPAQQRIIAAVKAGEAPNPADPALAGLRSKHNTYMSLPLLWAMANEHAFPFFGGNFGLSSDTYWIAWLVIIAIAWHIIYQCYRIAGRLTGM